MRAKEFLSEAKKKGKDGKACWKGYRYNGTEDGKDSCVKVSETARMSAAVKLQRAYEREQAKSTASRKRGEEVMAQARKDAESKSKEQKISEDKDLDEGLADWNKRAKELFAQGMTEQQVKAQLLKEGCPLKQVDVYVQAGQMNEDEVNLGERGKASKALCISSRPDSDLGASNLASCKSQGLRARDGDKSHKLGKSAKSRIKVGGHKIKGHKYGGPLPDWS